MTDKKVVSIMKNKPNSLVAQGGVVTGSNDFGDRLARIRVSLEKINKLMAELKAMSKEKQDDSTHD